MILKVLNQCYVCIVFEIINCEAFLIIFSSLFNSDTFNAYFQPAKF